MQYVFMVLLLITALFLILLVLVQRGKGGGLAGAFGGLGGQSAFGTKAGDLFTRVTIGAAAFWIILCMVTVRFIGTTGEGKDPFGGDAEREGQSREGVSGVPSTDTESDDSSPPVPSGPLKDP